MTAQAISLETFLSTDCQSNIYAPLKSRKKTHSIIMVQPMESSYSSPKTPAEESVSNRGALGGCERCTLTPPTLKPALVPEVP